MPSMEEISKLRNYYEEQVKDLDKIVDKESLNLTHHEIISSLFEKSVFGSFTLPWHFYREANISPSAEKYKQAGLDFAYRAGMGFRAMELRFFEQVNQIEDLLIARECLTKAATIGKDKEAEVFFRNLDKMINVYRKLELHPGYEAYDIRRYSVNELIETTKEVKKLVSCNSSADEVKNTIGRAVGPYLYLINKCASHDQEGILIMKDQLVSAAMIDFATSLDQTREIYVISTDSAEIPLNGGKKIYFGITKPRYDERVSKESIIELRKTLQSCESVDDFLNSKFIQ